MNTLNKSTRERLSLLGFEPRPLRNKQILGKLRSGLHYNIVHICKDLFSTKRPGFDTQEL